LSVNSSILACDEKHNQLGCGTPRSGPGRARGDRQKQGSRTPARGSVLLGMETRNELLFMLASSLFLTSQGEEAILVERYKSMDGIVRPRLCLSSPGRKTSRGGETGDEWLHGASDRYTRPSKPKVVKQFSH
jgi:hypothetical protein